MVENIEIIKKIGSGSFSECFLCYNSNKNLVAIKKSKNENKYEGIKYFELREIYCLLKLKKHQNIIPLFEISINYYDEYILVMKYIPLNLIKFVSEFNVKTKYIVSFVEQMLSVLEYMKCKKIIHTDIKSDNILIKYNEDIDDIKIYLIDFGSATIENITKKYSIVTTYTTRAPEIYNFNCIYDYKIDIWSFGMVLYFFIFGIDYLDHNKFHDKSNIEILEFIYDIQIKINSAEIDNKLKYLLMNTFIIEPKNRPDINKLIDIFEELYNKKVKKSYDDYEINLNKNYNLDISIKLDKINEYISSRLNYIDLECLDVAKSIFTRLDDKIKNNRSETEILYICWFINYQFVQSDVDYDLYDLLPLFNSFSSKSYNAKYLCELTYEILDNINFEII